MPASLLKNEIDGILSLRMDLFCILFDLCFSFLSFFNFQMVRQIVSRGSVTIMAIIIVHDVTGMMNGLFQLV